MLTQILSLLISHVVLPLAFITWHWKVNHRTIIDWFIMFLMTGSYTIYIYLSGRWDWLGYYLRYVLLILFIVATVASILKLRGLPVSEKKSPQGKFIFIIQLLVFLMFSLFTFFTFKGYRYAEAAVSLSFPLKNGTYYVAHGGNSPVINYHNLGRSQKFALDIDKLYGWGTRARGLYPKDVYKYAIFGDTIYSPWSGVVVQVIDNLPDQVPPLMDNVNLAGNYVAIRNGDVTVFMGHMKHRSIRVQVGDTVRVGQPIGQVGNSGNSSEPHLHIHAEVSQENTILKGKGVPIVFDGKFLKRNSLISINE